MQTTSTIPPKGLFTLKGKDFVNGLIVALFPHALAIGKFLINSDHWPTWVEWQPYIEMSYLAFGTYIGKNFFTNNAGQLFKEDQPVVTVGEDELKKELSEKKEKEEKDKEEKTTNPDKPRPDKP